MRRCIVNTEEDIGIEVKMELYNEDKWYALFVAPGEENKVKERISFKLLNELRVLVPKRNMRERKEGKWVDKIRILFPGYVLINGSMNIDKYNLIKDIPGVIKWLKDENGPQEIDKNEVIIINKLISQNEIIGRSRVCIKGEEIEVIDGPLLGLEAFIKTINKRKGRAKVMLNLMGEPRTVELSVEIL